MTEFERSMFALVTEWKITSSELAEYISKSSDQGYRDRTTKKKERLDLCIIQVENNLKFYGVEL